MVLNDDDHSDELNNDKMGIMGCKEIFKVVQSKYFSYIHCYSISSNYEKGITHSVWNLAGFRQDEKEEEAPCH